MANRQIEDDLGNTGRLSDVVKIERTPYNEKNSEHLGIVEPSGWYYDQQLVQPLTSVRLLANKSAHWDNDHWSFLTSKCYDQLIASSILAEDFTVDVGNSWVDNAIDDKIGAALNGLKEITPYLGTFHNVLKTMSEKQQKKKDATKDDKELGATNFIMKAVDYFGKEGSHGSQAIESLRALSNGAFLAQGCSFSYYGGTGVNFGNLGMRFTIFPNYLKDGTWKSVPEQVALLLPYVMGILQDVPWDKVKDVGKVGTDLIDAIDSKLGTSVGDFLESVMENASKSTTGQSAKKTLNDYLKWQAPPGGYDVDKPKDIDAKLPGTLCLEIGSHYKIEGLVVSGVNFQFSKQLVRNPQFFKDLGNKQSAVNIDSMKDLENAVSPLYCEVNLTLRPVTKYSSQSLLKFIYGNVDLRKETAKNILKTLDKQGKALGDFKTDFSYKSSIN